MWWLYAVALADQCQAEVLRWGESPAACVQDAPATAMGVYMDWYAVLPGGVRKRIYPGQPLPADAVSWELELTTSELVFVTVEVMGPHGEPLPIFSGAMWWQLCPHVPVRQPLPPGTRPDSRVALAVSRDRPLPHAFQPALKIVPLHKGGASWAQGDTAFCLPLDLPTSTRPQVRELRWAAEPVVERSRP
jgi:hypothetical protein